MKPMLALALLLAACGQLPRDTTGTLARVQAARVVRIGVVEDTRLDFRAVTALTQHVAQGAKVRPEVTGGAAEPLLAALDEGRLDLVIGAWAEKTPWTTEVTLSPPVAHYTIGETPLLVRAAVRNGENRWAMLVEHAAREVKPDGAGG